MLALFGSGASRCVKADWAELSAIVSKRGVLSSSDLVRACGLPDDSDHVTVADGLTRDPWEGEIAPLSEDEAVQDVGEELAFRAETLGEDYPFEISFSAEKWKLQLKADTLHAPPSAWIAYRLCLLISGFRLDLIATDNQSHVRSSADCMQRLAMFTVEEAIGGGDSYWFGWPRPDGTKTMRAALSVFVDKIGFGVLKGDDPAWSKRREKDGGVDVIAWKKFRDGRPGALVLYGQVASGKDWDTKPIFNEELKASFNDWFATPPTSHYITATFIPFMQNEESACIVGRTYDEIVADEARQQEIRHGLLIDRLRIVELASGAEIRKNRSLHNDSVIGPWLTQSIEIATA